MGLGTCGIGVEGAALVWLVLDSEVLAVAVLACNRFLMWLGRVGGFGSWLERAGLE